MQEDRSATSYTCRRDYATELDTAFIVEKDHMTYLQYMMGHEIESTLMEAVHIFGDPNVSYVSLPNTLEGEFGSVDHPGIPSHKKTADTLVAAISEIGGTSHG